MPSEEAQLPTKTVISVVDDDPSAREGTADLINSMGFAAVAFPSAEEFLELDGSRATSCVISDMRMPGMTGLELYCRLRKSGQPVPMILVTAFPNERDRRRALRAGVICYLAKPFNDRELLDCVHSALESRGVG